MTIAGLPRMQAPSTSNIAAPPPAWSASTFGDIDEQAAALHGWNQDYLQLSAGVFRGGVQRLQLGEVGLFIEDLHQAVHQTGCVRSGVVALGVPLLLQGDSSFCGRAGDASALHVFSGPDGFEFRSPRRHVMLGIEADAAWFQTEVLDASRGEVSAFTSRARLLATPPPATLALRRFLVELFDTAAAGLGGLSGEASRLAAQHGLAQRLAATVAPAGDADPQAATARGVSAPTPAQRQLVDRARQLASQRPSEPPSVGDLCTLLGVSRRTLQASFQATWGMAPLAWLNTLRLNAVRRDLKSAASVTEAATRYGFWHFGHFARDYRSLFGESPSQTLRRHGAGPRHRRSSH